MIFVPDKPGTNRPVVAWAHGTLGMGDKCAPTRAKDPISNLSCVSDMLKNGWVVTATDYAGLGTPGIQAYLVGGAEAQDVLNSVRAARKPAVHLLYMGIRKVDIRLYSQPKWPSNMHPN